MNIREYTKYKKERENKITTFSTDFEMVSEEKEDVNVDYIKKINRHRATLTILLVIVLIIVAAGMGAVHTYHITSVYTGYEVVNSIKRADAETARYIPYNGGILKYSNDGAAFLGADLNEKWNQTYQMQEPIYAICQSGVALADKNGTNIFVLDGNGLKAEVNTLLPIKKLAISASGITAATLEDSGTAWIKFYSPNMPDKVFAETKILMEESGYPVDLCLSDDGIKFGVSHLNVEGGSSRSTLAFHNLGSVGENEIDNFVGSTSYTGTVFPVFDYINADTAVAYGSDRIQVFTGKQIPELAFEVVLEEEIVKVCYDKEHIGVLLKNSQGEGKYRLDIYDLKGKKVFSERIDKEYSKVQISSNTILMYNESECCIYNLEGVKKFEKNYDKTLLAMTVTGNNRYMVVNQETVEIIRLVR